MEISTLVENVKNWTAEFNGSSLEDVMMSQSAAVDFTAILVITAVIGVLWCFLGLKIIRMWAALLGFLLGGMIGGVAAWQFGLENNIILIVSAAAGIIFACLGAFLYRVGIFAVVWFAGCCIGCYVVQPKDSWHALACVGVGFLAALFSVKFAEIITIIMTGLFGAIMSGNAVYDLTGLDMQWVRLLIAAAFAVAGIVVQILTESGKRKKKHLKKAAEIREQNSTANEVEKARAIFDEIDEDTDEDTDDMEIIELDD